MSEQEGRAVVGSRAARLARGWIGAAFATSAAAASHVLAGGPAPHPLMVALSLALSGLICVALAGKVLSLPRLMVAVAASQAIFHALFTAAPASGPTTASVHSGHLGHDPAAMAAMLADAAGPAGASFLDGSTAMGHSAVAMWAGHALACALTVLFLRFGETGAFRLLDALRLRIVLVLAAGMAPTPAPQRLSTGATSHLVPLADLGIPLPTMRHRGPPSRIIAA